MEWLRKLLELSLTDLGRSWSGAINVLQQLQQEKNKLGDACNLTDLSPDVNPRKPVVSVRSKSCTTLT